MSEEVGKLIARLGWEVDGKGLEDFKKGNDEAEKSAESLGKSAGATSVALGNLASDAIKAGFSLAKDLVTGLAATGAEIDDTRQKLQVAAGDLQRLRHATVVAGASAADLEKGYKKLQQGLFEAATKGSGKVATSFEAIGINAKAFQQLGMEEQIATLGDVFAGLGDDQLASQLAMELFGKSGAELVPLLQMGSEGIRALGDDAEKLGLVLSDDTVASAAAADESLERMGNMAKGAGNRIAAALLPAVEAAAADFEAWVAENDELIDQDIPRIMSAIGEATGEAVKMFAEGVGSIDDFGKELGHLADDFDAEYGDAVDAAIDLGKDLVGVWSDIAGAIGKGALELLEFLGVIEDADQAIENIKTTLGLNDTVGDRIRTQIARATGQNAGFVEGSENQGLAEQRALAGLGRKRAERERTAELENIQRSLDEATSAAQRKIAKANAKNLRGALGRAASKGKGKDKLDTTRAQELFGAEISGLADAIGLTGVGQTEAIKAAAKALEEGASVDIAREAAFNKAGSLTGVDLSAENLHSLDEVLLASPAGRGANPTAGAQYVTIDQSFNVGGIAITIPLQNLPAHASAHDVADEIETSIASQLDRTLRQIHDYYLQPVKS